MTAVQLQATRGVVTKATPLASLKHRRVDPSIYTTWPESLVLKRRCLHCQIVYKDGGDAWKCEHHHEGI
ncbi:hypothetical protein ED92_22890 [Amycolatopsis sp. MJM2582]|uniref:hypothetical protein n=1 Tax=unclassified Amycolatopsis TaxID=2618356 RepID=UPI0005081BE8|nr:MULTISPECIES: hypothetical protein [unclassified Amycolatopsis]KFZ80210.1 hypothetical protein ED92_22890 [Amycolatopsis sp. MJM2582]UMP05572.1 hypothetical protein MJQ72_12400 [Amycolatopsis sp. EV170708-02-1]